MSDSREEDVCGARSKITSSPEIKVGQIIAPIGNIPLFSSQGSTSTLLKRQQFGIGPKVREH